MIRYLVPALVFAGMIGFFYVGLQKDPKILPSALIDKPAPAFKLTQLHKPEQTFSPTDAKGKVWLLNVWASWCAACRSEHPLFMEIARTTDIPLYGLNYKDEAGNAKQWLRQLGDPYVLSAADLDGFVGIDFGVYGVPETFLIDKEGIIRYKHVGPVSRKDWREIILPKIQELRG